MLLFLGLAGGLCAQIEVVSGGNVGIGTTSPANRLHIDGTTGTPTSMPLRVDVGDNGSIAVWGSSAITYAGFTTYKDATQMWFAGREGDNYVVRTGGGANVFTAENAGAIGSTLYLKSGNVGIGTNNPGRKLSVVSSGTTHTEISGFLAPAMGTGNVTYALIGRAAASGESGIWGHEYQSTTANSFTWIANYGDSHASGGVAVKKGGNVGIGTSNPGYKLEVVGSVRATSFISNTTTYADFVFKPGYQLVSLAEVEQHINQHGHLPGVPSEAQVAKEGIDLAAMQVKLLQKIEELTLHVIRQEKEIQILKAKHESH